MLEMSWSDAELLFFWRRSRVTARRNGGIVNKGGKGNSLMVRESHSRKSLRWTPTVPLLGPGGLCGRFGWVLKGLDEIGLQSTCVCLSVTQTFVRSRTHQRTSALGSPPSLPHSPIPVSCSPRKNLNNGNGCMYMHHVFKYFGGIYCLIIQLLLCMLPFVAF